MLLSKHQQGSDLQQEPQCLVEHNRKNTEETEHHPCSGPHNNRKFVKQKSKLIPRSNQCPQDMGKRCDLEREVRKHAGNWLSPSTCTARHLDKLCCSLRCMNGTILLRMKLISINFCSSLMECRTVQQTRHCRVGAYCCVPAAQYLPARALAVTQQQEKASEEEHAREQQEQRCSMEGHEPEAKVSTGRPQPPHRPRHSLAGREQDRQSRVLAPQQSLINKRDINCIQSLKKTQSAAKGAVAGDKATNRPTTFQEAGPGLQTGGLTKLELKPSPRGGWSGLVVHGPNTVVQTRTACLLAGGGYCCNPLLLLSPCFQKERQLPQYSCLSFERTVLKPAVRVI